MVYHVTVDGSRWMVIKPSIPLLYLTLSIGQSAQKSGTTGRSTKCDAVKISERGSCGVSLSKSVRDLASFQSTMGT